MPPSPRAALEAVLFDRGPGWHRIGADPERLVSLCREWLAELPPTTLTDFRGGGAEARALWILDRLLPRDAVEPFRGTKARGRWGEGAFALWRRAPGEMERIGPEEFERCSYLIQAAWVDSRTHTPDLLGWYRFCREHGWPAERGHYDGLALQEYLLRLGDPGSLLAILDETAVRGGRNLVAALLGRVAGRVARLSTPRDAIEQRLVEAGEPALAHAVHAMVERGKYLRGYFPQVLWVAQRTAADLEELIRENCLERAAAVCPPGRFDVWERLLRMPMRGQYAIRRFCSWLDPEDRDRLVPHFAREDRDWAACAFHAWLWMLPDRIAARLAVDGSRPAWQDTIVDRFIHAPAALKPPPYVTDTQETEADFRLYDPFNVRSF